VLNREKIYKILNEYSDEYVNDLVNDEDRLNGMTYRLANSAEKG